MTTIRIGTRASALALWQARHAATVIRQRFPQVRCRLVPVTAGADKDLDTPLYAMRTTGVFCKEVHALVLAGAADIGVHSCKDLPTTSPPGISLAAMLPRHDHRDALIGARSVQDLPPAAVVGSSSLRRRHQLEALRPDLRFVDIRGNVATRLRKLADGHADATLLACAGLQRMGMLRSVRAFPLHPVRELIPAPAQGTIAIDCRNADTGLRRLLHAISHQPTWQAAQIERQTLRLLEGGCSTPIGVWARRRGPRWLLDAYLYRDGRHCRCHLSGSAASLPERAVAALQR